MELAALGVAAAGGSEGLFIASTIAAAAGTAISAGAAYQSSRGMQEAANRNAEIAIRDAKVKQRQYDRDAKRQKAGVRSKLSANGLLYDQSSSLDVMADIAAQHAERSLLIEYGGQVEAARSKQRANAYGHSAKGSLISGVSGVGAGLLGAGYEGSREFGWGRGTPQVSLSNPARNFVSW